MADPRKQLGGSVGEDLQTPMDFSSSCNNPFFRESGIFEEIITALRCENKEGTFTGQARTLLSIVSKETNLTIKLGYNLLEVSPNSSKDRIEACTIIDHDNCAKYLHRAEYFIDCSETGELAKMANAPGEDRSPINPDLKKSANPLWSSSVLIEIDTAPEETPFQCPDWVSRKWEDNSVSARLSFMESLEKQLGGYHLLEWIGEGHQCPDANELCWTAWDYIKNRSPLKEAALDLFVKRIIPLKNPRFVFRGTGDYQITQEDLLKGNTFKDSVAVGRCPIQKDGTLSFSPREKFVLPDSFEIPLRSLYSQKIKNLL